MGPSSSEVDVMESLHGGVPLQVKSSQEDSRLQREDLKEYSCVFQFLKNPYSRHSG